MGDMVGYVGAIWLSEVSSRSPNVLINPTDRMSFHSRHDLLSCCISATHLSLRFAARFRDGSGNCSKSTYSTGEDLPSGLPHSDSLSRVYDLMFALSYYIITSRSFIFPTCTAVLCQPDGDQYSSGVQPPISPTINSSHSCLHLLLSPLADNSSAQFSKVVFCSSNIACRS